MARIGIVGLGRCGSTLAFALLKMPEISILQVSDIDKRKEAGEVEDLYQALCMMGLEDEKIISTQVSQSDLLFICAGSPRQRMKLSGVWETDRQLFDRNYSTVKQIVEEAIKNGCRRDKIFIVTNPAGLLAEKLSCHEVGKTLDSMRSYSEMKSGIWILEQKGFTNFGVVAECLEIVSDYLLKNNEKNEPSGIENR